MKLFLLSLAVFGILTLTAQEQVTIPQIVGAENMFALHFTDVKRDSMSSGLTDNIKTYKYLHAQNLNNDVPFPLWYSPLLPGMTVPRKQLPVSFKLPDQVVFRQTETNSLFTAFPSWLHS